MVRKVVRRKKTSQDEPEIKNNLHGNSCSACRWC
jgi:hypothetical protein